MCALSYLITCIVGIYHCEFLQPFYNNGVMFLCGVSGLDLYLSLGKGYDLA